MKRWLICWMLLMWVPFPLMADGPAQEGQARTWNGAHVRLVHAAFNITSRSFRLGSLTFDALSYGQVTPYRMISAGKHTLSSQGLKRTFRFKAGGRYTLALMEDKGRRGQLKALTDPSIKKSRNCGVALYNFSYYRWLALHAPRMDTDILSALPPGEVALMPVDRPVTVDMEIRDVDRPLLRFPKVQLLRGHVTALFLFGNGKGAHGRQLQPIPQLP